LDDQREELAAQEPFDAHRVCQVDRCDCLVALQLLVAAFEVRLVLLGRKNRSWCHSPVVGDEGERAVHGGVVSDGIGAHSERQLEAGGGPLG